MIKMIINVTDEDNEKNGFICGDGSSFGILNVEGLESVNKNILTSETSVKDGLVYHGEKKEAREITLEFESLTDTLNEELRDFFIKFLNNDKRKKIIVELNNNKRKIYGYIKEWSFTNIYIYEPIRVNIIFLCVDPLFLNMSDFGQNIASINSKFSFPLSIPINRGVITGYKRFSRKLNIQNEGDYTTGIIVVFKAIRGDVINPKITKVTTGEEINIIDTMQKGDTIKVETNTGKKTVYKNNINISNKLTRNSIYFQITKGRNIIEYNADEGYTNLDVYIYYTPTYGGI